MHCLEYKTQPIKNGTIGYVEFGNGTLPLVMLIGYTGTLFHWNKNFVHELANNYRVYLLDNRHVGLSHTTNPDTMPGMALDVSEFIEALGLAKPWVLGWSMGGMVAQELASFYAHNMSGMILLASTPSNLYVSAEFIDLLIQAEVMPQAAFKQQLYQFFFSETSIEHKSYSLKENALDFVNYPYTYTGEAKHFQDSVAVIWQGVGADKYKNINLPILLLKANNDLVATFEAQQAIINAAPNKNMVKYIEYDGGGHFLVHKAPVKIAQDISSFIFNNSTRL